MYNEGFDTIELDSLYADLLNDYLNFFLPVTQREVNFPCFSSPSSPSSSNSSSPQNSSVNFTRATTNTYNKFNYSQTPSHLFKRNFYKSSSAVAESPSDFISSVKSSTSSDSITTNRMSDIRKIDGFLKLINQLLVLPFTDSLVEPSSPLDVSSPTTKQPHLMTSHLKMQPSANPRSSPTSALKYNDLKQNLSNLDIVFALSMILKHSHFFSNAFRSSVEVFDRNASPCSSDVSNNVRFRSSNTVTPIDSSPLDELRRYREIFLYPVHH